jgi:uncharacterized protein
VRLLLLAALTALTLSGPAAAEPERRGCGRHGVVVPADAAARPLPALSGRVADVADLFSLRQERHLVGISESIEAATTDQLVVVTVPSLEGESIESLGLRLGNGWRIGQAGLDNGVLLIIAPRERRVRIEVGCGLEGLLTDERAQAIIDGIVPLFAAGRFGEGAIEGAQAIAMILASDQQRPRPWMGTAS